MYAKKILKQLALASHTQETLEGRVHAHRAEVKSAALKTRIPVSVLNTSHPPEVLYIHLDGGVGDRETLIRRKEIIATMMVADVISPNSIHVSFSGGSNVFFTGAWETWIVEELPQWISEQFDVALGPNNRLLTGISGGGYGALRTAFTHPDQFKAVAALEPVIMPSVFWPKQHTRASWWMLEASAETVWGKPFPQTFLDNHPPNIAIHNADGIRASSLEIYLEVGDEDLLQLHDGAEFLHRILWQQDIPHEFHQVRWADHGGASIDDRFIEAMSFLEASYRGGKKESRSAELKESEQLFVDYMLKGGPLSGEPPPANATQGDIETELTVMAKLWDPLKQAAIAQDPDMARQYGRLPNIDDESL